MKMQLPFMRYYLCLLVLLIIGPSLTVVRAQEDLPVRPYNNPDEMITIDRETTYQEALQIINKYAQQYDNRFIIDRTGTDGTIGTSLPLMHWKDALKYILQIKNLRMVKHPEYYEIIQPQPEAQAAGQEAQGGGQGELNVTTGSREVRIKATFFEGNRRALREIGVDWSTLTSNVPDNISAYTGGQQSGGSSGGSGGSGGGLPSTEFNGAFVQVNQKGAQSVSQDVFNGLVNFGEVGKTGISVQALFSAFEADNLGQILAKPEIKVMDGEEGRIQVGQDFSIKQKDFSGNTTEKFFSVGTILTVTPHIISKDDTTFIHMEVQAERSSAQPDPVSTIINKQVANSQILLLNGESTVIAGLYRTENSVVRKGVPILKDLPPWFFGLRYLFGYNSTDQQVRELVILINAEIEPGIPDRFHQEHKGSYELLQEKRKEMNSSPKPKNLEWKKKSPFKGGDIMSSAQPEKRFYIVANSFKEEEKADAFKAELSDKGYDAKIIQKKNSDFYLVTYYNNTNLDETMKRLDSIQQNVNEQAWLYVEKL